MIKKISAQIEAVLKLSIVVSLILYIFVYSHASLHDLDIWLHLKAGEVILENKSVPAQDLFSFTRPGKPWVDHEWLFQILVYSIYSLAQADGLVLLQSLIIILSFLLLFFIGYKITDSYLKSALLVLITAYACASRFNIRPDIFSMLFFAACLYILKFHSNDKSIWLLVPIQLAWVNLHGYFFLGPLLVFFFILAEFLRRSIKILPAGWKEGVILEEAAYRTFKKVLLFTILACLFNPAGIKGALYPFYVFRDVVLGRAAVFFEYIQELKPTYRDAHEIFNIEYFYLLLILSYTVLLANFKTLKVIDIILAVFSFLFSFKLRNIGFCAFISFTIAVSYLERTIAALSRDIHISEKTRNLFYIFFKYAASLILLFALLSNINASLGRHYYDFEAKEFKSSLRGISQKRYPAAAVDFILKNRLPANMFNDFNSGAYLIGKAYPERRVFIDGRTEFYGQDFFKLYIGVYRGDPALFEKIVEQYQLSAVLLSMSASKMPKIATHIYKSPQWKLVYFDDTGVVFLKDTPSNHELIAKFGMDLKKYRAPQADLKDFGFRRIYPDPYIKRAGLFDLFEEDEAAMQEVAQALRIMPGCAEAYHLMGKVYLRQARWGQARESLRAAVLLYPSNVDMLLDLARCLNELKENKLAINALKRAIKIDGTNSQAYSILKGVYVAGGNQAGADWAAKMEEKFSTQGLQAQINTN